jgi:hypothetical protein
VTNINDYVANGEHSKKRRSKDKGKRRRRAKRSYEAEKKTHRLTHAKQEEFYPQPPPNGLHPQSE